MSGFNPFRARNLDGSTAVATSTPDAPGNAPFSTPASNPVDPIPCAVPDSYRGKSALSLEIEEDDHDSTSSDDQRADPFNPDSSVSDDDDEAGDHVPGSSETAAPLDDRPPKSSGSAPHLAPSADGSTTTPSTRLSIPAEQSMQSATNTRAFGAAPSISSSVTGTRPASSPEDVRSTSPSNRSSKERKPPPPPRSHHGKRISGSASAGSSTTPSRPNNRLPCHGSSPETSASTRMAGTPSASSVDPSTQDYFSVPSEHQDMIDSADSLHRSDSQHKRPPAPPLSRRQSQMQRSKSTQSQSSGSRVALFSYDSESNDSSQPPSPGPSRRSPSSPSQERKRISMPPSAGDLRAVTLSTRTPSDSPNPTNPRNGQPGRRASSHGSILSGSSSGAPPPPPPRRARDPSTRSSESGSTLQPNTETVPLPQPSNAQDILADLSRLQKEVDDLRGHYENRQVSQ